MKKRFNPVDFGELRGAEFYQLSQTSESVEKMGVKLQTTAWENLSQPCRQRVG